MEPTPTPSSSSSTAETTAGLADILRFKMLFATLPDQRTTGRSTLHILRAWVSETGLSVGHEVCAEKSNEIEALPRLLGKLQLHGATVTIDAMGGHPGIARMIQNQGADYLLALKANEKKAHQAVTAHFESLRLPVDETHTRSGWVEGCEVSATRELSAKVLKSSPLKGSVRSKRKRCALDPAFRSEVTRPIFHGFGA